MFIAALFTIAKMWKQLKYPLTDGKRKCGIYIPEILLILKKEILQYETTWMSLEDIMLRKPIIERQIPHDFTNMRYLKHSNS